MKHRHWTVVLTAIACASCSNDANNGANNTDTDTGTADVMIDGASSQPDARSDANGQSPDMSQPDQDPDLPTGTPTTAGVFCDHNGSGDQRLEYTLGRQAMAVDEVLPYEFRWVCDGTVRTLTGNGVPDHGVADGRFATRLSVQNINRTFPIEPVATDNVTESRDPGAALNSVKFDPATAGTCPDDATDESDCAYAMGRDDWQMVATAGEVSPWRFGFGVDQNDAHVQPNGQYHYHANPVGLVDNLNPDNATTMTLVGWAVDGFPIYSLRGHSNPADSTSSIVELKSSYQTLATPAPNRPSVDDFPLGHFVQDWEYAPGSGDLDECNGRFGVTPEFPNGIYHYYITSTYPFIQRCVKG